MAAEVGLLSMTQIQKLSQSQHHQNQNQNQNQPQPNPNSTTSTSSWMWNPRENQEDDDSWEVRAFAEDTRNIMGTTWPPRSYTCTFCRREFRSAQALGGHMNVHRRDRARLHHQTEPCSVNINSSSIPTSSFIIPAQELVANGGLCLLYRLPNPNGTFTATPSNVNACAESPSTLLSISPYPPNNLQMQTCSPSFDFPVTRSAINSSYCNSSKAEQHTSSSNNSNGHEELDLELRLGHRPTTT
ncbi:hypothetical protein L6164_027974 [Bauhinia variegata]|uniref:Uncharacterized protein n=1 Tax=Bauhinia variegata TaxID=167791 RepID=A0ACB9LUZ9_BAUVA|nr:hypothetical protein L6164_027974 [Bauhinia variegata]